MVAALILSTFLISDTLYLNDGTTITGKITTLDEDSVTIGDLTFPRSEVSRFAVDTEPSGQSSIEPKNPATALALSLLLPGGGYFYAEDRGTGTVFLLSEVGLLIWAAAAAKSDSDYFQETGKVRNSWSTPLLAAAALRVLDIMGAPQAAVRYNAAHGLALRFGRNRVSAEYVLGF